MGSTDYTLSHEVLPQLNCPTICKQMIVDSLGLNLEDCNEQLM